MRGPRLKTPGYFVFLAFSHCKQGSRNALQNSVMNPAGESSEVQVQERVLYHPPQNHRQGSHWQEPKGKRF